MVLMPVSRLLESRFEQCSDQCGWIAAFFAALSYGTFGVPIKETVSIDVHPLVLQSYKTGTMFLFSWFIIYMGESIRYTPWGLLSGLLWVGGGCGGIYGIRNAGMSVASGTWSSCMVIINFLVGICLFHEPVASITSTFAAFVCLGCGLVGMSVYSAPTASQTAVTMDSRDTPLMSSRSEHDTNDDYPQGQEMQTIALTLESQSSNQVTSRSGPARSRSVERSDVAVADTNGLAYGPLSCSTKDSSTSDTFSPKEYEKKNRIILGRDISPNGWGFTQRQLGIGGAVINGVLTGSSFIPIHYAKKQGFGGAAYMLSFASGAVLANVMIWVIWFFVKVIFGQRDANSTLNFTQAYDNMPHWHFRQLWAPGFAAGTLLSIAMFGSILSVTYLGQGVGNSIVQSKILISGLWGIFWYREIVGRVAIAKWFASAAVAVFGILWLSYERLEAQAIEAQVAGGDH